MYKSLDEWRNEDLTLSDIWILYVINEWWMNKGVNRDEWMNKYPNAWMQQCLKESMNLDELVNEWVDDRMHERLSEWWNLNE